MKPFTWHEGLVAPMDRANVDTDLIIPKQFLKSIQRSGFGPNLFDELRYLDEGQPGQDCSGRPLNPDFPLNQPRYAGASVLLARDNFGCGSSREHAPWALEDYGFRCIIAPSFADIFYNNCFKNGLLPVVLSAEQVEELFGLLYAQDGFSLTVDLTTCEVRLADGRAWPFTVEDYRRQCLLEGLDDIGVTLKSADAIRAYEARSAERFPWLFTATGWAREPPRTAPPRRLHRAGNRPRGTARARGGGRAARPRYWIERGADRRRRRGRGRRPAAVGDAEKARSRPMPSYSAPWADRPTTTCRGSCARSAACCDPLRARPVRQPATRRSCIRSWWMPRASSRSWSRAWTS
jgi:3-isopropylmalate/(R)-2-methylmalate dehydratase small subunit